MNPKNIEQLNEWRQALKEGRIKHRIFSKIMDLVNSSFSFGQNPLPCLRSTFPSYEWTQIILDEEHQIDHQWQYLFQSEGDDNHRDEGGCKYTAFVVAKLKKGRPLVKYSFTMFTEEADPDPNQLPAHRFIAAMEQNGFKDVEAIGLKD